MTNAQKQLSKGNLTSTENVDLVLDTVIQDVEQDSTYKNLGINEGDVIQHAKMKEKIRKEYTRRIRLVLDQDRSNAINTLVVPVVTYSFDIINWNVEDLKKLDRKTRKLLTMGKMHHP